MHKFAINMCELEDAGEVKCVFRKDVTTAKITVDREYPPGYGTFYFDNLNGQVSHYDYCLLA